MMENSRTRTTLFERILFCGTAAIVASYPLRSFNANYFPHPIILPIATGLLFFGCLTFFFIWHFKEQRKQIDGERIVSFFQSFIAYCISLAMVKWGLLKVLRLHMTSSLGWRDMPSSSLLGEKQVSHFFGQHSGFAMLLAALEITGALFLLFKKTRLIGIFTLLPVTVNIIVIDYFYSVPFRVLFEAVVLCLGLVVLLYSRKNELIQLFFNSHNLNVKNPTRKPWIKNGLRLTAFVIPFLILFPHYSPSRHKGLVGKYEVKTYAVNNVFLPVEPCSNNVPSYVYFDLNNDFFFSFNNFNKLQVANLYFDEKSRHLKGIWRYPENFHDTLFARLTPLNSQNRMTLEGKMGRDSIKIDLHRTAYALE